MTKTAKLPLDGMRVLDFSHAAAGPVAAMFLGDFGAEVIKIEKPGRGDGVRFFGSPLHGEGYSDYFAALNRNKRSLLLDLSVPEGSAVARRMAAECDIVIENFRPGVMDRLGLGFKDLSAVRPRLVYGSISAFGESGPWRDRPANDIIMQAVSGLMSITGEHDGPPVRVGGPVADYGSGLTLLSGVLAALLVRDDHPEGQHVRVAMLDAVVNLMGNFVPGLVGGLYDRVERDGSAHSQIVPYQAFECSDGEFLMVGAFTNAFWIRLCGAMGHAEWVEDPRFRSNADRLDNRELLVGHLSEIFLTRTRPEWQDALAEADVPASPILELQDAIRSPQAEHNELIQWLDDGNGKRAGLVRSPIRNEAWPEMPATFPPPMGRDTAAVLKDVLDMDPDEIDALVSADVARGLGEAASSSGSDGSASAS